jgi:hypothetical protein
MQQKQRNRNKNDNYNIRNVKQQHFNAAIPPTIAAATATTTLS